MILDCGGQIRERRQFTPYTLELCPTALAAWQTYCAPDPASGVGLEAGRCRLVDYYGQPVELLLRVPPHRFRITPWPIGMVAREGLGGDFHPTARLVWEPPPIPHVDSGWRLWTWGASRGPGQAPFPCEMDEGELMAQKVPAGTTCVRLQLWAAPDYDARLRPLWVPGRLGFPALRWETSVPVGQVVAIHAPYASHPRAGGVEGVRVETQGRTVSLKVPVFLGYFHRPWMVRVRLEERRVRDLAEERERCEPLSDADGDGRPEGGGDCWTLQGDPPRVWPGKRRVERVIVRKEWETAVRDGILNLSDVERPYRYRPRPYPYLHPVVLEIVSPEGSVWRTGVFLRDDGQPWLQCPLGVREGQGAVCSDPTCGGYAP